jgi:hypothetical protein
VTETTLADWAADDSETASGRDWREAARLPAAAAHAAADERELAGLLASPPSQLIGRPAGPGLRAAMLSRLANATSWKDALPDLVAWYARFGHGVTAHHVDLEWKGGGLVPRSVELDLQPSRGDQSANDELTDALRAHSDGTANSATTCLIHGSPERCAARIRACRADVAKSRQTLLRENLQYVTPATLRWVKLPRSDLATALPVLMTALRAPALKRMRFVVVVEPGLELAAWSETHVRLRALLQAHAWGGEEALPRNVFLIASSCAASGLARPCDSDVEQSAAQMGPWDCSLSA